LATTQSITRCGGFAGLSHQVSNVDAGSVRFGNSVGNLRDQQVRKNAGVERTGSEKNQVGFLDGFDSQGKRTHAARGKLEVLDRHGAGGDARFAVNGAAVFEGGDKMHVRERGRKDASADGQHFAADADGFGEIAGDMRERGQKKIAEIVADKAAAGMKTILEQAAKKRFIL